MNFCFNRVKIYEGEIGPLIKQPINKVRAGRFTTYHKPNGEIERDLFWHDEWWVEPKKAPSFDDRNGIFRTWFCQVVDALKIKGEISSHTKIGFRMYCNALDTNNFRDCLIRLWAVAEHFCLIEFGERHEKIADRIACLYADRDEVKLYIHHLRSVRNDLVHRGGDYHEDDRKHVVMQLNRFVCEIMGFFVAHINDFKSLNEIRMFLDFPENPEKVESIDRVLGKVKWFRRT